MIKSILLTFSTTLLIVTLVITLFLNTILGVFGLATTSIESLQNLKISQQVVERMKARHGKMKQKAIKRFAKRPLKRITTAAIAAATVGTVAVAVTVTGLEVADYCDEQQQLREEYDILYGTNSEFDYAQCFEEGKQELTSLLSGVKDSSITVISDAWKNTAQYSTEKWANIKESSLQALESTDEASTGMWDAAISWVLD